MSYSTAQIYCSNPTCSAPLNEVGRVVCANCHTPLTYRYLWAVGSKIEQFAPGQVVAGRYYVSAPRIWLDTQPRLTPDVADRWSDEVTPYLHLYPYRLHLPEVYGFYLDEEQPSEEALLLENVPLDASGLLYPSLSQAWLQATAVRQVYWLWQLLQLWTPLLEHGVVTSLLAAENLRVEGWRVRLCQLYSDKDVLSHEANPVPLELGDLANRWLEWVRSAKPSIAQPLLEICQQMQAGEEIGEIAAQLNQLLLEQAAQLPLRLQVAGVTDTGPERSHNEDTCYPTTVSDRLQDGLAPQLAIVCDGIGGHEGGEVASQLAVEVIKPLVKALLTEVGEETEPTSWEQRSQQLEGIVRVANNQIAAQNDAQGREERQRMGTTLVMALQVPQPVALPEGGTAENSHELYLVHLGDSRAYWITPRYCQRLTIDDDVASREVRMGRALYREALIRPDSGALTQALGTRQSEYLRPTIQRFVVEEDGVLMLCSDGLSDNGLVEQFWSEFCEPFFKGKQSLEQTAKAWVDLANQKNGYDNTSVVLMDCHVSSAAPSLRLPRTAVGQPADTPAADAPEEIPTDIEPRVPARPRSRFWVGLVILALLLLAGGIGLAVWRELNPSGFQELRDRVLPAAPKSGTP